MKTSINAKVDLPGGYIKVMSKEEKGRIVLKDAEQKMIIDCDVKTLIAIAECINQWTEAEHQFYGDEQ